MICLMQLQMQDITDFIMACHHTCAGVPAQVGWLD